MTGTERALGRTLVTGGSGFLGAALIPTLKQRGVDVVATDVAAGDGMVALDLRDEAAVLALLAATRFDTVLHCGAVSGPMVMADQPLEIWKINAGGTANILEAARRSHVGRVVVCSTVEVYGEVTIGIADEHARPQPDNVYGASKAAAEQASLAYHREHGLDVVVLRFSWIYGPGRKTPTTLAALLKDSLNAKTTQISGHPDEMTHYLYIDDAVDGLIRAATVPTLGDDRIFNITAGQGVPLAAVLEQVREVAPNARIDFQRNDDPLRGPIGFRETLTQEALGFRAQTTFKDGLARYLSALRQSP